MLVSRLVERMLVKEIAEVHWLFLMLLKTMHTSLLELSVGVLDVQLLMPWGSMQKFLISMTGSIKTLLMIGIHVHLC